MNPIYPCIWTNNQAREAAEFYTQVFPDSKILESNDMTSIWTSYGQTFMCLNGGPMFQPNPSISFYTLLPNEQEIKKVWEKLKEDGEIMMDLGAYPWSNLYGWVKDRFGVSWQLDNFCPDAIEDRFAPAFMLTGNNFGNAEDAIQYYTSIFPDSSIKFISRYGEDAGSQSGKINHAQFYLNGQLFVIMESNMDHAFTFSEGISMVIPCQNQEEIDHFWNTMTEEGEESQCGWLKDKYGVSWQVVPQNLGKLIQEKGQPVIDAFLKMKKFDLKVLEEL